MPLTPLEEAEKKEEVPPSGSVWQRETAAGILNSGTARTALSDQDTERVMAMGLTGRETDAILRTRVPGVYDGYRDEDTYELTRYVNDANRGYAEALMEYTGAGKAKARYTYGLERLSTSNAAAAGALGQRVSASYVMAGDGSVSSLVSGAGRALLEYSYGPFGETAARAAFGYGAAAYPIEESFYAYNGESYDPLTGLQYLRARYYSPGIGRFHVADTYLGEFSDPLSRNLYAYVKNDPVNNIDPSGHEVKEKQVTDVNNQVWRVRAEESYLSWAVYYVKLGKRGEAERRPTPAATVTRMPAYIETYIQNGAAAQAAAVAAETVAAMIQYLAELAELANKEVNKPSCTDKTKPADGGSSPETGIPEYIPATPSDIMKTPIKTINDANINKVDARLITAMIRMALFYNVTITIKEGFRTKEQQQYLYDTLPPGQANLPGYS